MVSIIYMALATAMFSTEDTYFSLGGRIFSLKNPCAVAILFLALLTFIVTARLDRLIVLVKHTLVQTLPYTIPLFFSAIIWVGTGADSSAIMNGVSMVMPQLLAVLVAVATLYLFGGKGIWYCLGAMCIANFLKVLTVIQEGGIVAFLLEFRVLLETFSVETGPLLYRLEIHDLTFAFGPFLFYLLLKRKETPYFFLWLLPVLFFFLVGLKRIAVLAVAVSFLVTFLVGLLPEKGARQILLCIAFGMMLVSFLYVAGIRNGLFEYLENHLGLDTKGRVRLFSNMEPYYDINFTYIGRGIGFERFVDWVSGKEYQLPQKVRAQIHNDFLRMYMNIGFVGYWVWCFFYLFVRLFYWFRQGGKSSGCLFLGICIYCYVLYATDNTIYYPYTTITCTLIPMSYHLDELAEQALKRFSARWDERNYQVPDFYEGSGEETRGG